jgi:hypothetical protein
MRIKGIIYTLLLVLAVLVIFAGCNADGGGGLLYVVAAVEQDDGGTTLAAILIFEGSMSGSPVTDATVTVNGTAIPHFLFGSYVTFADLGINASDAVTMNIQRGSSTVNATLQMPNKPSISTPNGGTQTEPVNVTWSIASSPDQFVITVDDNYTVGIDNEYTGYETGSATGHSIPAGTFDTTLGAAYVEVTAVESTTALGSDVASGSVFEVGNTDESVVFDPE